MADMSWQDNDQTVLGIDRPADVIVVGGGLAGRGADPGPGPALGTGGRCRPYAERLGGVMQAAASGVTAAAAINADLTAADTAAAVAARRAMCGIEV